MTVEVLYVPGCPNYQPTMERVATVLASEFVLERAEGVAVNTEAQAKSLGFPGSPTVRVNGKDIEPAKTIVPALACRIYANGSGVPPEHLLRTAILRAKLEE